MSKKPLPATQDTLFNLDMGTFQLGDILRDKETGDLALLVDICPYHAYIRYLTGALAKDTNPYWHYWLAFLDRDFERASKQEQEQRGITL
jgi:hypothetical protein